MTDLEKQVAKATYYDDSETGLGKNVQIAIDTLNGKTTKLENKYESKELFEDISGTTTGTVTTYTNISISQDAWAGQDNAIAVEVQAGRPTQNFLFTASGEFIEAIIDTAGNYTLSGTPTASNYAICWITSGKQVDYANAEIPQDKIIAEYDLETPLVRNSVSGDITPIIDGNNIDMLSGDVKSSTSTLNTDYVETGSEPVGTTFYDAEHKCYTTILPGGVKYQHGQEIIPLFKNQTGSTIPNGTPVMFAGAVGASGRILIRPAIADGSIPAGFFFGLTTQEILNGEDGKVATFGAVRGIKTDYTGAGNWGTTWVQGNIIYVSADVTGVLTNVRPSPPNYTISVGTVQVIHATQGQIGVRPNVFIKTSDLSDVKSTTPLDGYNLVFNETEGYWEPQPGAVADTNGIINGLSVQRQELDVVVDGTHVYLDVQAIGGGDIDYWIDNVKYTLDCTTGSGAGGKARIEIPQGTAIQLQTSIVYVQYSEHTSALELAITPATSTPKNDYSPVAIIGIQDYASVAINSALVLQRTTEAITHDGKGAVSWEREKLRALGAQYWSGADQSLNITTNSGSEDDIDFAVTIAEIFQLHLQQLAAASVVVDGVMIANASGDGLLVNYEKMFNLNKLKELSDGTALVDGDCIVPVLWGAANYGGVNRLFVNAPNKKYTDEDEAINDVRNSAITAIPPDFRTVGYLIAKAVWKYSTADGGTWENLLTESVETWHTQSQTFATPNYPSDYPNSQDLALATLFESGAEKMRVVFNDFNTEANYDFVTIRNATDAFPTTITERRADPLSFDGNLSPFTSPEIVGDTIKARFTSDGSVTRSGAQSISYEYMTSSTSGQEIVDLRGIPTGFNLGAGGGSVGSVKSVFGRVGHVLAQSGDYDASKVTNAFDKVNDDTTDIIEGTDKNFISDDQKTNLGLLNVAGIWTVIQSFLSGIGIGTKTTITEDVSENLVTKNTSTTGGFINMFGDALGACKHFWQDPVGTTKAFINSLGNAEFNIDESSVLDIANYLGEVFCRFNSDGYSFIKGHLGLSGVIAPQASLHNGGGEIKKVTIVTSATYTVLIDDFDIDVQYTTTGAVTITIPVELDYMGRTFIFTDTDGNAGTNNISVYDDAGTPNLLFTMSTNSETQVRRYNGTSWALRS